MADLLLACIMPHCRPKCSCDRLILPGSYEETLCKTTKLSTKGQVILPKPIREAHRWRAGTEFAVEEVKGGVLLSPLKPFSPARLEDVSGCLHYRGKPKTVEEMEAAIVLGVKERHARGRY